MLRYAPTTYNSLSRRAGMSAAIGAGASKLAADLDMPADMLKMANAQESAWEPMRQLFEMSGLGRRSMEEMLFLPSGELNMDTVRQLRENMRGSEDFSQLLQTDEARQMIARAGGNPDIDVPRREGFGKYAEQAWQYALDRPESLRRAVQRADLGREGQVMFGLGGLAAGAAVRQGGLLSGQPQEREVPALLRGQRGLLSGGGR